MGIQWSLVEAIKDRWIKDPTNTSLYPESNFSLCCYTKDIENSGIWFLVEPNEKSYLYFKSN